MKSLLLISHFFPPVGGGAVQRALKLAKYLPQMGWRPLVLAALEPPAPAWDESLLAELPPECLVTRVPTPLGRGGPGPAPAGGKGGGGDPAGGSGGWKRRLAGLAFPDVHLAWLPGALRPALALAQREGARAVMVTAPPFSSFLLGWAVARRLRLPLVLDFRDEWTGFYNAGYSPGAQSPLRDRAARWLEARLVGAADLVTTASPAYGRRFRALYGGPAGKYLWLPNGYDPTDFPGAADPAPPPSPPAPPLELWYAGTVFGVTSLRHLWAGLALLDPAERAGCRVRVAGRAVAGEVIDPGLAGLEVRELGYVDHGEVTQALATAGALVLTLEDLPGAGRVIPAKLYEYLAARRPILALVPPGVAARLVRGLGAGQVVPPGDPAALAQVLREWLAAPPLAATAPPPPAFSRQEEARFLARRLDRLTGA
ncbi:MAG: glycosyltransferase [Deltaproteobacteria bacterium]|nr:glycosyltransferase [Deltaproteobacteria bacterium]